MENKNLYNSYSRMIDDSFSASREAREAARQKSISQAEKIANENLSQEYIRREQAKKALPQQAAIFGLGGASESAAIEIDSAYGKSRNNIYNSKQNAINDINISADKEAAAEFEAYQKALMEWEQERAAANRERERYNQEMSFKREQFEYQKQQDNYEREKQTYERRQKELLAAQKAARSQGSTYKSTKKKSPSQYKIYPDQYINGKKVLGKLF